MHLKQKGYSFGVVLIYTITTIALASVSRCEPTASRSVLTTESSTRASRPEAGEPPHLSSRREEEEESALLNSEGLFNGEGKAVGTPEGRSEEILRARMASSSPAGVRDRHKPRQAEDELVHSYGNCREGKIKRVIHGKFFITGHLERNVPTHGYQLDSSASVRSVGGQARLRGRRVSSTVESWQKLQPVVECNEDGMTLTVRRRRAVQLLLDPANESSVPLSQLPPQCGYSLQNTWKDLRLIARYDACHIAREDGSYVLPLLWRGTPVKMTCPVSPIEPQAVGPSFLCCSLHGMTVKVHEKTPLEEQRVNVRGEWTPLALLVERCGYTLDKQDADTVIAAPFITCGITEKDGEYMLSLQIGKETFTLVCPVSTSEDLPINTQPLIDSPAHLSRGSEELMLGTQEPFPWAPPVFLAPPYYPHPTYHRNYPNPKVQASYNTPALPSLTPETAPESLPPVDSQPDHRPYYFYQIPFWEPYERYNSRSPLSPVGEMQDLSQVNPEQRQTQQTPFSVSSGKHRVTPTGFPAQVGAPHFQPLSHDFNVYYHYYHHPKIPLSATPQNPDPGPDVSDETSSSYSRDHEFSVQQSESIRKVSSEEFPPPASDTTSHPYTRPQKVKLVHKAPALHAPDHLNPYLYYYYYFPHISRGEAKRLVPSHPDVPAKANLSNASPLPHSQMLPVNERGVDPYINLHMPFEKSSTEPINHPFSSAGVKSEHETSRSAAVAPAAQPPVPQSRHHGPDPAAVPLPRQHSLQTPPFIYHLNPYQYYYHPYYHYYQTHYRAGSPVSPASSQTSPPPLQASTAPLQHLTPPAQSMHGFHNWMNSPYYYLYNPSEVPKDNELQPTGSKDSANNSDSQLSSYFDQGVMDWFIRAAAAGYFNIPLPLHNPFHSLYSHSITQQHHEPSGQAGGDAKENLDSTMRDYLEAHTYTPSASPCSLGPASDTDCSDSSGCCSNTVKGCTAGQYCIFAVPDSVAQPTVASPAHSSEDTNASCTLQRLTPDLDIYIVPLDGCGVNKHMLGETMVHLLEVQGIQDSDSARESSPVRLMVGCSYSPDSPGEARFHVMDEQPPLPLTEPTPVAIAVQLRIAKDETFTSYHPEAHLPLSLVQGRPVYVEVSLKDPPEPIFVLLIHSCLAYTEAPFPRGMLVYDGCSSLGLVQMLPSSDFYIRKIMIYSFLFLPPYTAKGDSVLEDPEIYFLCLTEVCSGAHSDCTLRCLTGKTMKRQ